MALSNSVLERIKKDTEEKIGIKGYAPSSEATGMQGSKLSSSGSGLSPAIQDRIRRDVALKRLGREDTGVDEDFIKKFQRDFQKYIYDSQYDWNNMTYQSSRDDSIAKRRTDTERDLSDRATAIRTYLDLYGDNIDEEAYKSLSDYMDQFDAIRSGISHNYVSMKNYYSQFDTEDDYNAHVAKQKDYEEKSKFDIDAGQKEIASLEEELKELKRKRTLANSYQVAENAYLGSPYAAAQQGNISSESDDRISELEKLISQKKQYLNQAKHIQEGITLSGVAGNKDFASTSQYKTTIKEDASWWEYGVGDTQYEWINNQNGFRDEYESSMADLNAKAGASSQPGVYIGPKESIYKEKGYDYLTENEIAIYNYYYAKEGKDKAQEYLDSIQETLNIRKATGMYEDMEENTLYELVFGVAAGLDQFKSGTQNLFNTEDDYIPQTAYQIASGMVREDLADDGFKLPTWLGGASLGQVGYDAITTSANMAPSILASVGIGILNPTAGAIAGNVLMGASAAGNAYQEVLNNGYDKGQARLYSSMIGASEAILGQMLGGISKLGGTSKAVTNMLNGVDNAFLRFVGKMGGSMISEGFEEGLQEVLTPMFENLIMHTDKNVNWSDVAYSYLLGSLTAGIVEGPTTIAGEVNTYKTGKQLQAADISAQSLAEIGRKFSADTVAYQLAGRVNENTGAYTMGRLFNEIGATLTEQNVNDITKFLVQKNMPEAMARKNAKVLAAVVDGAVMSDDYIRIIEANEPLAQAVKKVIINPNSTVYQRTKGYNDALRGLAQEKAAPNTSRAKQSLPGQENTDVTDKVDTQEENGAESEYEVSTKGKTILKPTGKMVSIKEVADINDGKMMLRLEDGSTVDAGEVSYASQDEALVYETVAQMGASVKAANILVNGFKANQGDGLSASVYAHGIDEAFQYGKLGIPIRELARSTFASKLNAGQQEYVYRQGQRVAGKQVAKEQATVSKKEKVAATEKFSATGNVHFDRNGRTFDSIREVSLTTMEQLSKALGVEFYVFESYKNENGERVYKDANGNEVPAPNGYYDPKDGSIHIDLNAGIDGKGTMLFTIAHELTHFIKQWSPAKFKVLANFLVKHYGEKGVSVDKLVDAQIAKAMRDGRKIGREEAYEEMVADSMETMLTDGNVVQMMADLKQQDRSLWQKICDWFKDLAADLQALVDAYKGVKPNSKEGKMVAQMQDVIVILESLYADALVEAGENYQVAKGQKNTNRGAGEVKHHARPSTKDPRFLDPKTVTKSDVVEMLRLVENGKIYGNTYFPVRINTPSKLIYWAFERRGDVIDNNPIAMSADKAYNAMNRSGETEKGRPNSLSVDELVAMIDAMNDPRYIVYQSENDRYVEVVEFNTESGDTSFAIIEIGNAKDAPYMNGYEGGLYNILVTTYPPKSAKKLRDLLNNPNNEVIYDKKKDASQRTSSSTVPSVLNDASFFDDSVPSNSDVVKGGFSGRDSDDNQLSKADYRYSGRTNEVGENQVDYGHIMDMNVEVNRLTREIAEFEETEEFKTKMKEIFGSSDIEKAIKDYTEWRKTSGYEGMIEKRDALKTELEKAKKQFDEYNAEQAANEEKTAVEKSGLSEAEYFRKQAVKEFGYTPYFYDAGYITPNGKMLNFSGEKGKHFGSRGQDHRAIGIIYENTQGTAAMVRFMNDGNIRIMAETPGLDISSHVEPTKEQYATIRKFAKEFGIKERYFAVDISDENGRVIGNYEYDGYVNADRVVNDIKYYFENGKVREQSSIASFLQSARDQEAEKVSKVLQKENDKLKEDVKYLKELLKLQRSVTDGTKFTKSSVEAAAWLLMKSANAKGDKRELAKLLDGFYGYIAKGDELTWEGVSEAAQPAVDWLQSHVETKKQLDAFAEDVLRELRGSRTYLDETQKKEAAYKFGSYNEYRKKMMGTVIFTDNGSISLDSMWHELSSLYPSVFDPNTNATDMPEALMDAVDRLRNMDVSAYEYAYDDDMMAHDMIRQVYDTYWNVSTLKTVADVKQKEINRLKGEHINRMTKLKEYHKEKTEQLKKEHKEELKRVREEYRQNAKEQQQKIVDKYQESRKKVVAKVRETAEKRDAKAKLQKLVLDTVKWISHPAKTAVKCPDILKQPYADFLNSIDMSSERLAKGGDPTKNDLRLANAMGSLATALDKIMSSQDPTQDTAAVLDAGYLDLPANFVQKLRDMTEDVKAMMIEGEYVVNAMTAEEIRKLSQMIRTLNHAIKEVSTLYANLRFANVEMLGDESMAFMDAIGEIQKTSGTKDFVQWENALPYYAFKRFGKGGESIFEGLMDAQDKLAFLAQNIFNFQEKTWKGDEAKKWSEDTHTIDLPDGEQLTITTADAMSIYCLSRRQQGLQHLMGGGVRVMGIQKGSQKAKDSRSTLTIKDIDAIISSLTDRQKKVAEAIQEFMSTTCSEWGNEISMKRFLTKEFNEKFYFPIESNDENLPTKDPYAQQSDLFRLLNISATKAIDPRANNEVIIRNIFDVFTGHASDMARLNAFGLPLLDYMKWLNYREKTVNEDGQIKVRGVRKYMETAYGNAAKSYVLNLIKDVNGRPSDNGDPSILMKWMRSAKTASVGSSLRVATLQLTSYPRAALVLSPKSLALGLTKAPNIEKAKKYCGIALWKSFGFYDTNISRSIEEQMKGVKDVKQKLIEFSLKGAEIGDAITWGAMWNACEYEIASTKKYKVGSEEFYEAVGKKLREVVYRTQVVDSTLTRSQIMRSKRGMAQETAAFMSEPTLSANILMDAGMEFSLEKRRTNAKTAWKKTGKYVTNALAVYSIGQLTAALLEGLWDAWRDDEDEEFGEKFVSAFTENLVMDLVPFNKIPIVSDVFEAALAMIGVGFYSSDKMSTTWLTQAVSAADAWRDVIGGNSSVTTYNALYKSVRALSSFYGVSASGVMREGVALWNNTAGAYDVTLKVLNYDRSKAELGALLLDALVEGNDRQADSLRAEFEDEDAYQSALRSAIKERYLAGEIDTSTAQKYLVQYGGKDGSKAHWLTEEWMYESDSDEDFGKYNKFFDAVKTGKNLKTVIKEYTANGVKPETLAGQITEHFKPEYMEMTRSEKASIKGYLLNAFEQCGVKREDAAKKLQHWEFLSEYPDSGLTQSQVENYHEFAKTAGISAKVYIDYCHKAKGISKKEDLMDIIDSLPINSAQKDALYYAEGWAASKLNEAPWH